MVLKVFSCLESSILRNDETGTRRKACLWLLFAHAVSQLSVRFLPISHLLPQRGGEEAAEPTGEGPVDGIMEILIIST